MLIRRPSDIAPSEITPRGVYLRRREFLAGAAALGMIGLTTTRAHAAPLQAAKSPLSTTDETVTPLKDITSYNNFYEFGTDKGDPAKNAHTLKTKPWKVKVDGLVGKPGDYDFDDLVKPVTLEERIYRMRCVEGWSMVIPWVGFPLAEVLKRVEPQGSAKFVAFETLVRPGRDAGPARAVPGAAVALRGGPAARRGHASAHHPRRRPLRRDAAQPERRADPAGRAVEVRLQEHQVDRAHQPHRQGAADLLEDAERARVRLLFQRQPAGRSSALEPGDRAAHRRGRAAGASAGRRCRSTATASRSRASTRAWTSKPTTEMARPAPAALASTASAGHRPDPARHLHRRHAAGGLVFLSRHHRPARRRSAEHAGAAARPVGAALPDPGAGRSRRCGASAGPTSSATAARSGCSPSTTRRCISRSICCSTRASTSPPSGPTSSSGPTSRSACWPSPSSCRWPSPPTPP